MDLKASFMIYSSWTDFHTQEAGWVERWRQGRDVSGRYELLRSSHGNLLRGQIADADFLPHITFLHLSWCSRETKTC